MDINEDLRRIAAQEQRLAFDRFDSATAWALGSRLKEAGEMGRAGIAIDISLHTQPLFYVALPGATADNADWVRRKRNVTLRFLKSSYAVGLSLARDQTSLAETWGLDPRDYASHGGSFPIVLAGFGCIGAVTVSGLPQREDHALVVDTLARLLGRPIDDIALPPA